jgi:hypothetical protein
MDRGIFALGAHILGPILYPIETDRHVGTRHGGGGELHIMSTRVQHRPSIFNNIQFQLS